MGRLGGGLAWFVQKPFIHIIMVPTTCCQFKPALFATIHLARTCANHFTIAITNPSASSLTVVL